jgi:uncharacterized phage-associated protein
MAFHFIAIVSHYTGGQRIAWHYSDEKKLDREIIHDFLMKVKRKCGDVQLGIHKLSTDSVSWESVVKKDAFFADVFVTRDIETFIKLVSEDQELSAYDVAKFILSVIPSSHLKLQKLLYFAYAEFLLRTGEKLFKEPILAFKYGPVVQSVFQKYKVHGSSVIDCKEDEKICIFTDSMVTTPSFMKIASSEHGMTALDCILTALKKYGHLSAGELVEKTHKKGGPWDRVYEPGKNAVITDDLIIQYHQVIEG